MPRERGEEMEQRVEEEEEGKGKGEGRNAHKRQPCISGPTTLRKPGVPLTRDPGSATPTGDALSAA